ncbi:hypothetical protein C0992_010589 [Termitomyces sp. T32_za158]|nr:hypothetical protein C0992_010589 [Termitomyces sp. T32_za158]
MRRRERKVYGKTIPPISIQRSDATKKKRLPSKKKIAAIVDDESKARREAFGQSHWTYLACITPELAEVCKLPRDGDGVKCYGCAQAIGTILSADTRQGSHGRKIKGSLSRRVENMNRSGLVKHDIHNLPWGSLIWIRFIPGILHGRVSYKDMTKNTQKPEFSWHTQAFGTASGCTSEKFRAHRLLKDGELGYNFILDPDVSRQSFAGVVLDLLAAFDNIYPKWALYLSKEGVISSVIFTPPPFWALSKADIGPFCIPHSIFTGFIDTLSNGNTLWFTQSYRDYVIDTFSQLTISDSLSIYGALFLFIAPVHSAQDVGEAQANWHAAFEAYKQIVMDLPGFDEEATLLAFEEQFGAK